MTFVLRAAGITKDDDEAKNVVRCPRCHFLTPDSEYCSNCGALLKVTEDDLTRLEANRLMYRVL